MNGTICYRLCTKYSCKSGRTKTTASQKKKHTTNWAENVLGSKWGTLRKLFKGGVGSERNTSFPYNSKQIMNIKQKSAQWYRNICIQVYIVVKLVIDYWLIDMMTNVIYYFSLSFELLLWCTLWPLHIWISSRNSRLFELLCMYIYSINVYCLTWLNEAFGVIPQHGEGVRFS